MAHSLRCKALKQNFDQRHREVRSGSEDWTKDMRFKTPIPSSTVNVYFAVFLFFCLLDGQSVSSERYKIRMACGSGQVTMRQ